MGDSGPAHQVRTFSSSANDLHTGGILQVIHTRDCPITWSTSVIVSDKDPRFTVHFWKSFPKAMETQLTMSAAFHP